jgi:hypothetical protein
MSPRETAEQCLRFLDQLHDLCEQVPAETLSDGNALQEHVLAQAAGGTLVPIPSRADIASIREWVTAALPVVEAVRKWQPRRRAFDWAVEAQPRPENYMTIAREFQEAQNKMLDLLADAVLPENEP